MNRTGGMDETVSRPMHRAEVIEQILGERTSAAPLQRVHGVPNELREGDVLVPAVVAVTDDQAEERFCRSMGRQQRRRVCLWRVGAGGPLRRTDQGDGGNPAL